MYIYIYIYVYTCIVQQSILWLGQQLSLAKISRRQPHYSSLFPICENFPYLTGQLCQSGSNKGYHPVIQKVERSHDWGANAVVGLMPTT